MAKRRKTTRKRKARRKPKRKSVVQIWSGLLPPMKRADFQIGGEFVTAAGRWRCTDVGKRTIIAIRLNHDDDPIWYSGPPYAAAETVFDEYDFQGCASRRRNGVAMTPARRQRRSCDAASAGAVTSRLPKAGFSGRAEVERPKVRRAKAKGPESPVDNRDKRCGAYGTSGAPGGPPYLRATVGLGSAPG